MPGACSKCSLWFFCMRSRNSNGFHAQRSCQHEVQVKINWQHHGQLKIMRHMQYHPANVSYCLWNEKQIVLPMGKDPRRTRGNIPLKGIGTTKTIFYHQPNLFMCTEALERQSFHVKQCANTRRLARERGDYV